LDDVQAAHFNALLVPESPLRVYEATRWSLAVDVTKLTAPILIVSGALDILTPPETGAALAALYGATYQLEPAHGHNVLLGEGARRIAEDVIAWVAGSLSRSDAHMTAEERMKVMNYLEESRKEFLAAIDGVTEEQWKWKPAPERWSVGETAEHIVLAEALLFGNVQKAIASQPNPAWEEKTKGKTEFIEKVMAPRLGKATAPEPVVPGGKVTQAQVRETFLKQRVEIEKFAAETQVALKEYTVEHPFTVFNTLNAYQWLIYAPLHTERHDKQIAEVKATQGYPKIVSNP
jgi:hypothetical protein